MKKLYKGETVLITGVTGLLGSYLLMLLLQNGAKVFALGRAKEGKSPRKRIIEAVKFWNKNISAEALKNLKVVEGDITYSMLGIVDKRLKETILSQVNVVFHVAAYLDFRAAYKTMRNVNVIGTKNFLRFCVKIKNLKKINYISTAFVVGNKEGIEFKENMFDIGQGFNNNYERSKFEAEKIVRKFKNIGIPISIYRPSIIVGDSKKGKTNNLKLIYEPLHFFSKEIYNTFPGDPRCSLNLINVDIAAKAILILSRSKKNETYHITSPKSVNDLYFMNLAAKYFNFNLPNFIPVDRFNFNQWTAAQKKLAEPFVPYCNYRNNFLSRITRKILAKHGFDFKQFHERELIKLFQFCVRVKYIRRKIK